MSDTAETDFLVVGSGAAALTAALVAAAAGADVLVIEKTDQVGGTSAMSGAATWVPANHHARAAGIVDSPERALAYIRATAPEGWQASEDRLWRAFSEQAAPMLEFVESHTPIRFALTSEPDVFAEAPGAAMHGRMLSPRPLPRRLAGPLAGAVRRSTLPHLFTYHETLENDLYRHPFRTALRLAPRLIWRLLTGSRGKGTALIVGLVAGCIRHGCRIELRTQAVELTADETGRVTGAVIERDGRRRLVKARRGVLLATGGFEWNEAERARHFPGPIDWIGSPRGNAGDALRMARAVGADVAHMDQALIFPSIPTLYEGRLQAMPVPFHMEPNAILVDRHGRRFVNEFAVDLGEALDRRDPATGEPLHLPVWLISDSRFLTLPLRWHSRHARDWIMKAPAIEDLAQRIGLDPAVLSDTVRRFNGFAARGHDDDFQRGETVFQRYKRGDRPALRPIERLPFVAIPFNRSILATKGGLRTNEHGQVLRPDGSVIAGLYCAGAAMANPIGTRAISAGTTIGPNMAFGYICAKSMLTTNVNGSMSARE